MLQLSIKLLCHAVNCLCTLLLYEGLQLSSPLTWAVLGVGLTAARVDISDCRLLDL